MLLSAVILVCFLAVAYAGASYNGLVTLRNRCDNQWSQIDIQLKRRNDLIPKLVEMVRDYAAHERKTFEDVAKARSLMVQSKTVPEKASADGLLKGSLTALFAVAENYPQLKANSNFLKLQGELTETENSIAHARQFYNDIVERYETKRRTFPSNIIAHLFTFTMREFFNVSEA